MSFYMTPDDIIRFWTKVSKKNDNECWLWTAGKDKDGYGQFWLFSCQRSVRAHRIADFSVTPGTIHAIKEGRTWQHV
jgi:hypothetical protein